MVFTEAKLERDLHCQEAANTRQTKLYTHSAFATAILNQSSCCFPNRLAATTLRVKWWGYSFVKLAVYMSSPITSRHWHRPISLNNKITNCQADFFSFIQNVYYKVQHPQNANYSIYRRNRKSNLKILKARFVLKYEYTIHKTIHNNNAIHCRLCERSNNRVQLLDKPYLVTIGTKLVNLK